MVTNQTFQRYIQSISQKFSYEETTEMGYRADFEVLLKDIFESINVSRFDHDAKAIKGNKPDFVIRKNNIPILYIEVKDIGVSLDKIEQSEQMSRYFGYTNLILSDYCEFRFYHNGLPYCEPIKIAKYEKLSRTIAPFENNFSYLEKTILDFVESKKEPIKSGKHLAKIMGGKAQRIRDNLRQFFEQESKSNQEINKVYDTIKKLLVHDLSVEKFTDMYAQTLVYGLFVARYYDESPSNFTRQEARDLIPKTNPFLRHFFDHIVGPNFDKRLEYIVDELCEVFTHANIPELMKEYFKEDLWGVSHTGPDPVIHFYEDFLKEYDSELKKKMGAYYTPKPVVHFIVYSVDSILKKVYGLKAGLADTEKLADRTHRVQILDLATGTGTFIGAIIGAIFGYFEKNHQEGRWPAYVHNDLLPRVHGFELMMAPYTIAHLKLAMAFGQTGFKYFNRRLGIYLTNTLDTRVEQPGLFALGLADSIAEESKEASNIKTKTPIMVVLGNPPYSGESSNSFYTGHDVYKVEPTGGKLKEKNSKWINDDYVKFIRFAENQVEKTGEGIVAMITAHGYIDNPTFRGMRWHLMNTFDEIYVLDLHGNSNKKERAPDGGEDKNVFDIKTGVAIIFGIKKKDNSSRLAKIHKADLYGKRPIKFEYLNTHRIDNVEWTDITPSAPNYEWIKKDIKLEEEYNQGFRIDEFFVLNSVGVVSGADPLFVALTKEELQKRLLENQENSYINKSGQKLKNHLFDFNLIQPIAYRPYDTRYIYYAPELLERSRHKVMQHVLGGNNIGISWIRPMSSKYTFDISVSKNIIDQCYAGNKSAGAGISYLGPLTVADKNGVLVSNLNQAICLQFKNIVGDAKDEGIFYYIYAVLNSKPYQKRFQEQLKTGLPRIPYPSNKDSFEKLAKLGQELKELHLLESPKLNNFITSYPQSGSDQIDKLEYKDGNVYINHQQYFGNVPENVWSFYVGGYQPAQKWLKDRKGRKLANDDLEHYQKIIVAINETLKIMGQIEEVWIE